MLKGSDVALCAVKNEYTTRWAHLTDAERARRFQRLAQDEIYRFEIGRYISASEAVWSLLNFPITKTNWTVHRLPVHLPGEQRVSWSTQSDAAQRVVDTETLRSRVDAAQRTELTAFFELCRTDTNARK